MTCPKCGNELDNESKFCPTCGNKTGLSTVVDFDEFENTFGYESSGEIKSANKSKLEEEIERRRQAALERESISSSNKRCSSGRTGHEINRLRRKGKFQGLIAFLILVLGIFVGYSLIHILTTGITLNEYKEEIKYKTTSNAFVARGGYGKGLSCRSIYMSYKKAMEEAAPILAEEYKQESEKTSKDSKQLEQLVHEKIMQLALIEKEGIAKMGYMSNEWIWEDEYKYDYWSRRLYDSLKDEALIVYEPYMNDLKKGVINSEDEISNYSDATIKSQLEKMLAEEIGDPSILKEKIAAKQQADKEKAKLEREVSSTEEIDYKSHVVDTSDLRDPNMPIMAKTSINDVKSLAKLNGLSQVFPDENFGYGTMYKPLDDSEGGIMLGAVYSMDTNELLYGQITTNNMISKEKQKEIVISMAAVMCPPEDADRVVSWVKENVGSKKKITISGFTYELGLGNVDNVLYYAGYSEWNDWAVDVGTY